jgi:hypothetical protein
MIPDNIQANIMKYLNNGVSGSSQPQKPVLVTNPYSLNYRYYLLSNSYITDDNYYIVNMGMYKPTPEEPSVPRIGIFTIEDARNGTFTKMLEIPNIGEYYADLVGSSILRDEEGRFYGLIFFNNGTQQDLYLVIFNDFLTDGIIQINYSFKLNQTFTIDGVTYSTRDFNSVIKHGNDYYLTDPRATIMLIGKVTINVGEENKVKLYYKLNATDSTTMHTTINTTGEGLYGLIMHDYQNTHKISKITFPEDNNESTQELILKNLFTWNNRIGHSVNYDIVNNNGNYIDALYYSKDNNNLYTTKYVLVRADETIKQINLPFTFTTTTSIALVTINYTIKDNLIFARFTDGSGGTIEKSFLFKIKTNTISQETELTSLENIDFARLEFIQQYNLYYCFTFSPLRYSILFIIRDVPTYGRDCILKQKLLNSKLFRAIKFKRNR